MNVRSLYRSKRWEWTKKAVKKRDGYRCTECGNAGRLEVHHKVMAKHNPELFFRLDNLASLCRNCHIAITRKERFKELPPEVQAWRAFVSELL